MERIPHFALFFVYAFSCFCYAQTACNAPFAQYGVYDTDGIKPVEYHQRRAAVMMKMDSNSAAIFRAMDSRNRSMDMDYKYRQNSNFLYLTGCNEQKSTLVLVPSGVKIDSSTIAKEILFVRPRSKSWTGNSLGLEGAKEVLGFGIDGTASVVLTTDKLIDLLPRIFQSKKILYYISTLPKRIIDPIADVDITIVNAVRTALEEKYPNLILKNSDSLVSDLRVVKSPAELTLMQKAIDATTTAQREAMKSCAPGMYEYELQAMIEYCFTRSGCEFYGFPSIVGSGPNAMSFHYDANRRQMLSGELVVMDVGAEYHGYSADVTRTIPVNGKFTAAQKEIYELVLSAQEAAFGEIKPGVLMSAAGKKAMDVLGIGLVKLGIIKEKGDAKKYCPHSIDHFVGLDVHDVGSVNNPLVPGVVFTVEPGLYIPDSSTCDEKYWGIGIRIEDDVLVTVDGCKVLSITAPRIVSEIEKLMGQKKIIHSEVR